MHSSSTFIRSQLHTVRLAKALPPNARHISRQQISHAATASRLPVFSSRPLPSPKGITLTQGSMKLSFIAKQPVRLYHDLHTSQASHAKEVRNNVNFIWGVLAANAAIFLAWQFYLRRTPSGVVSTPTGWRRIDSPQGREFIHETLNKYFLLRVNDWRNGNYLSSLGSAFSHINPMHLLGNAISLYAFANTLAYLPGIRAGHLATLVFGSALFGSAGFVTFESRRQAGSSKREKAALGASGVVMGLGAAAFALMPYQRFLIYGIVPVPLWILVPGYFFFDAYYLDSPNSHVAHSGHLGGAAFGLVYAMLRLRGAGRNGIFRH